MDFVDQAITNAAQRALHLGYHKLHPNQFKAVRAFIEGRDVFLALPPGSGKSLCYAVGLAVCF